MCSHINPVLTENSLLNWHKRMHTNENATQWHLFISESVSQETAHGMVPITRYSEYSLGPYMRVHEGGAKSRKNAMAGWQLASTDSSLFPLSRKSKIPNRKEVSG